MKELTIEEKAKAYDKAVSEIRNLRDMLLKEGIINKNGVICNNFNRIFPELKESEDETIRKALIEMVHDTIGDELWVYYGIHKEEALAWLKSLRPQNRWKPSDEQMYWLKKAIDSLDTISVRPSRQNLESLYNDLKKLREE